MPLFLAPYKKFHDISYSSWENISTLVDKDLVAAMYSHPPEYNSDELLQFRVTGSTVKSGDKAGDVKILLMLLVLLR